jgi:hypothetical protein
MCARRFSSIGTLSNSGKIFIGGGNSAVKVTNALLNTGTIDLNGALVVDYSTGTLSPLATLQQQIAFARDGGAWDRIGITSSAARDSVPANLTVGIAEGSDYLAIYGPLSSFAGYTVNDHMVLMRSTYYGDGDLNGIVNFDDYSRTDAGFNNSRSGWFNGDFDYNGLVNFDDYSLIDAAFNTQSGSLRRAMEYLGGGDDNRDTMNTPPLQMVMHHFEQFGQPYATAFINSVPEPTSALSIGGLAALAAGWRPARRHRRRAQTRS